MSRIFDADNAFFRFMGRVADAIILNIFFLITSLPIVTMGASYTAMYYYCTKAVANEEGYLWKSYWKSFKTNFVQGFLMEVFFVIVGAILYIDIKYLYGKLTTGGGIGWRILFFIVIGMAVLAVLTFMYAFPILSRFDNTTFNIIKNAAFMSIRHLPQTVPLLLILGVAVLIGYLMWPIGMLFVVGAWVYISSIFFQKVLDRYMPKDERYDEDYYLGNGENADAETQGNADGTPDSASADSTAADSADGTSEDNTADTGDDSKENNQDAGDGN